MKRKILNISDSPLINKYLKIKAEKSEIDFINARDGLDGLIKMRNMHPDLVIMDFNISRITLDQFLSDKYELKGTKDIPIILFYSKKDPINKNLILKLAKSKIFKLMLKPIDIDKVIFSINNLFKTKIITDSNECMLDINYNDNLLFIQISKGFNQEEIELMKYKLIQMKKQPKIKFNKVITVISDIYHQNNTRKMLDDFMFNIINSTGVVVNDITVFTTDLLIKDFYYNHRNYQKINITDNYSETMDNLKKNKNNSLSSKINNKNYSTDYNENFINNNQSNAQNAVNKILKSNPNYNIAVLNNDEVCNNYVKRLFSLKGWEVNAFTDHNVFMNNIRNKIPDLIFFDISLIDVNGFSLLKYIKEYYYSVPIIILTTSNVKEHVINAKNFGIKHYFTKPFNPRYILDKTEETLFKSKAS